MVESCALGLDLGSTTAKLVLLSPDGRVLESRYVRHGTAARRTLALLLEELSHAWPQLHVFGALSGSAALGLADALGLPFVQEVMATARALAACAPQTDVAIELGGEDAKILYLSGGMDLRMNEACAGGTGAFIDQMAALLGIDTAKLDHLAADSRTLYPIASRCGVFAKTDVVPLLNEGVPLEDIAASILQAVVDQTVGGLACGNPIRGRVAFLGGPLHFLPELKKRFVQTLGEAISQVVDIEQPHFVVAMGAALDARLGQPVLLSELAARAASAATCVPIERPALQPLFETQEELRAFRDRHSAAGALQIELSRAQGPLFLGLDFGSTTVKAVLINAQGAVASSWYGPHLGNPLRGLTPYLVSVLRQMPPEAYLAKCAATGYGAQLACAALGADVAEVETLAHLHAARALEPEVSYVVDIGGQDMKCLKVENGLIADVTLNEACSAGCGAFLENFAQGLGLDMSEFVQAALSAQHPVDLGSRCTVFMNSKVRQAQKEGAEIGDIAAGLCYSVARNALYKVLRIRTPEELGNKVVVQGGAFLNDALLRAMERLLGKQVLRPELAGLMGAYGAALTARNTAERDGEGSSVRSPEDLAGLTSEITSRHCSGCGNRCLLTVHAFSSGGRMIAGNRCERGSGRERHFEDDRLNMFAWKLRRLFEPYKPLELEQAPRGRIGLPRVLNMYEFYPFWFTLFTRLGFRVELSSPSSKSSYLKGLESAPSQSLCFPAKLAHSHVDDLIARGVERLFYPCIPRTAPEHAAADDCYSCPIVCSYPEVVRLNTEALAERKIRLHTPFVRLDHPRVLTRTLSAELGVPAGEMRRAVDEAARAQAFYQADVRQCGEAFLAQARHLGRPGIVLAGRPYHVDPLVHHGLADLAASLGAVVLSEDAVAHLAPAPQKALRVVDQWAWHSRLYRAAHLVSACPDLELVQLTSFGCGLDAVTSDQVHEILRGFGKLHVLIKIDEGESLGAARIRLRSLLAAMSERSSAQALADKRSSAQAVPDARQQRVEPGRAGKTQTEAGPGITADDSFMREPDMGAFAAGKPMRFAPAHMRTRVILAPQMAPLHFRMLEAAMRGVGYNLQVLPHVGREDVEMGLRYVNNDACYPAVLVVGQLLRALQGCDPHRTALLLAQTCGPCRATNYIPLLHRALGEAGFPRIPVLSLNRSRLGQPCLDVSKTLLRHMVVGCLYADMLQRLSLACRSYERHAGDTDELLARWLDRASVSLSGTKDSFRGDMRKMVRDFSSIVCDVVPKPRVGVVGEILLRYHPDANNHVLRLIGAEGGEPVLTELMDFLLYCLTDQEFEYRRLGGEMLPAFISWCARLHIEHLRDGMRAALAEYSARLPGAAARPLPRISELAVRAGSLVSLGNRAGEGWLLAADMLEFMEHGVPNVLCLQPFGCLPNHVTGKGVIKALKRMYPSSNVVAVDYDPSSSEANQSNRIKLFMSVACERGKRLGSEAVPNGAMLHNAPFGGEEEKSCFWPPEVFMPGAFMLPGKTTRTVDKNSCQH